MAGSVPVGVVSLGLDVLLDSLDRAVFEVGPGFAFRCSNATIWRQGRLAGLVQPVKSGAKDKERLFREAVSSFDGPFMVLGHNQDESLLCRLARESEGLAVGMGAEESDREFFDLLLPCGDWSFLAELWMRSRPLIP